MNEITLKKIAHDYQTPAYVFDLDMLRERIEMIQDILGTDIELCYAMKANPFLIDELRGCVQRFEVCSPGEFRICERSKIPMERIVLSGVYKEEKDIERVIDAYHGEGIYTIESLQQLELLSKCADAHNRSIQVLLRVTSGNQFGLDEDDIRDIAEHQEDYPHFEWKGLQFYSGTQKKKKSKLEKEMEHLDEFCKELKTMYQFEVKELEYGPGFFVPYFQQEQDINERAELEDFLEIVKRMQFDGKITLEMGRYIAATCGFYITSIVDAKVNHGERYCIIDGGINHINYYGQTMAMKVPEFWHFSKDSKEDDIREWNICGALCTVGDVIVKNLPLNHMAIGDILVFGKLGAYSVTEGIYLFLSRDLPKILFYTKKDGVRMIRETKATDILNSIQV